MFKISTPFKTSLVDIEIIPFIFPFFYCATNRKLSESIPKSECMYHILKTLAHAKIEYLPVVFTKTIINITALWQ
jgi:hypothetical protein